jgi:Ca2+-binding RTX toxin-like protein
VAVNDQRVYWSNGGGIVGIGSANLNGTDPDQKITGFTPTVEVPQGVAVGSGSVYFAIQRLLNPAGWIGQTGLTGGANGSLFDTADEGGHPVGVAVDSNVIYWANNGANTIGRANIDGSGVPDQSFITGASDPQGVAVDGTYIYWANGSTGTIGRANIDGSGVPDQSFITGASRPTGVAVDGSRATCAGRAATIVGTGRKDSLRGTKRDDVIAALGHSDTVAGLGGDDLICGAGGNNRLRGNNGDDVLRGGVSDDVLRGGRGADVLRGGRGADALRGGGDADRCRGGHGRDRRHGCRTPKMLSSAAVALSPPL